MTDACRTATCRGRNKRAFSLVEAVASIVIVGVMLVAALNTVAAAKLGTLRTGDRAKGMLLAQQLMAEILGQSYEEPTETVGFGREVSEPPTGRAKYDDVDDYDGWSATPPEYKDGTVMPDLDGWGRKVSVDWVNPPDLAQTVEVETNAKLITVIVMHNGVEVASLTGLRTLARDNMEE